MKRIHLYGKYGKGKFALVDDNNYDMLVKYTWYVDKNGYAKRSVGLKTIYMHRIICPTKNKLRVDHIDRDTLNNVKQNLRLVTNSLNMHNRGAQVNSTSGTKGVFWYKNYKKWESQIQIDGKKIRVGYFKLKEDAILARLSAEEQLGVA